MGFCFVLFHFEIMLWVLRKSRNINRISMLNLMFYVGKNNLSSELSQILISSFCICPWPNGASGYEFRYLNLADFKRFNFFLHFSTTKPFGLCIWILKFSNGCWILGLFEFFHLWLHKLIDCQSICLWNYIPYFCSSSCYGFGTFITWDVSSLWVQ